MIANFRRQAGFTLIEILVALVFIALVGLSTQQRIGQFHDERLLLRERQQAHWVAWNRLMAEYQLAQGWYPANDTRPTEKTDEEQLSQTWYLLTERTATVTDNFFRYETSVYDTPVSSADLLNNQQSTASLAMFLVTQN